MHGEFEIVRFTRVIYTSNFVLNIVNSDLWSTQQIVEFFQFRTVI